MTHLNLAKNNFTTMPAALWTMEVIEELNFTSNKYTLHTHCRLFCIFLTKPHCNRLKVVPPEIGALYCMRQLFLGNNEITSVPSELVSMESLETLHLFFNKLTKLPDEIGQVSVLYLFFRLVNTHL